MVVEAGLVVLGLGGRIEDDSNTSIAPLLYYSMESHVVVVLRHGLFFCGGQCHEFVVQKLQQCVVNLRKKTLKTFIGVIGRILSQNGISLQILFFSTFGHSKSSGFIGISHLPLRVSPQQSS